jgi:hypothetical protein
MRVIRIVPNVASEASAASRNFSAAMFDLVVGVELHDWYLQLVEEADSRLDLGFVRPGSPLVSGGADPSRRYGVVLTMSTL